MASVDTAANRPQLVLIDLSSSPHIDLQAAETLGMLHRELATAGVQLQFVEAHAAARDTLRNEGLEEKAGTLSRFTSVADAVDAFTRGAT